MFTKADALSDTDFKTSASWTSTVRPYALALLALVGSLALALAIKSLWCPAEHDTPLMLYRSRLVITGQRVIYRDLFDFNFPACYLIYGLLGIVTGMNEALIQLVDVALFAALVALSVKAFAAKGRLYSLLAVAVFACFYFAVVTYITMQREYFILLTVVLAAALMRKPDRRGLDLLLGALAAFAFLIKPHAAIGFVWLAVMRWSDVKTLGRSAIRSAALQCSAFGALLGATFAYLSYIGALKPLLSAIVNYLPLYAQMDGNHWAGPPEARRLTFIHCAILADDRWLLFLVAAGVAAVLIRRNSLDRAQKRSIKLALGLTVSFWLYPMFSGGFFPYHWLPFNFFLFMLTALCFQAALDRSRTATLAVGLAGLFTFYPMVSFGAARLPMPILPAKNGRVDALTDFLKPRLRPGDTVQPLDLVAGAIHAMLRCNANIATPFLSDFHFYHNVSSPYIQGLRQTFLKDFDQANPRFVISCYGPDKPWPLGIDSTKHFPELEQRLDDRYDIVYRGDNCMIYELKTYQSPTFARDPEAARNER